MWGRHFEYCIDHCYSGFGLFCLCHIFDLLDSLLYSSSVTCVYRLFSVKSMLFLLLMFFSMFDLDLCPLHDAWWVFIYRFGGTQQSQGLSNPYRYASSSNPSSNYHSSYVPYYKLQQMKNETKEKERVEREKKEKDEKEKDKNPVTTVSSRVEFPPSTISSRVSAPPSLPVTSATTTTGSTVSTTSTTPTTITTPTSSFVHFRK